MATLPTQKLNILYESYKSKEIAFNKSIRAVTGLEAKKVCVKIHGDQWPCVLYSCSMTTAKVIITLDNAGFEEIKRAKNIISLKLSFFPKNSKSPITFFVSAFVKGFNVFKLQHDSSFLMSLEFTQKPPDDLIEIIGKIFESISNFEKRSELRINLDPKVVSDMGLVSNNAYVLIDNIKRPCILRNVSPSGCAIILVCNPKFVVNKKAVVGFYHIDSTEPIHIDAVIKRYEDVSGRTDIFLLGLLFDSDKIPYEFKSLINDYIDKLEDMAKFKRIPGSQP